MAGTALLVMDVQQGIVDRHPAAAAGYLSRLAGAIDTARARQISVIYVIVQFRSGHPEISDRNPSFAAIVAANRFVETDPAIAIPTRIAPAPAEPIVIKRRVSAFVGSDLDLLLRAGDIDTLVLTGIATSGVVPSTLRQAADLDYRLIALSDACFDADPEVDRVLVKKVFPRQAEVLTITEWTEGRR